MLDKFLSLLERLVLAQEAQAEAAKNMAFPQPLPMQYGPARNDNVPAEATTPEAEEAAPSTTSPADAAWNPLVEQPMGRYTKEKTAILDAMLAERGIDASKARTGQEKHTLLLKWEEDKTAEAQDTSVPPTGAGTPSTAPAATAPAAGQPAATPAAEPVTRAECQKLSSQLNEAGHSVADITAIWRKHNGDVKPKETPEDKLPAVKAALLAAFGGGQAKDEEGW